MPKLHLVGITADHKGLVFNQKARAKTGDLVLEISDDLVAAIEEARRLDARSHHPALSSPALPTRQEPAAMNGSTGGSRLSPKEIQHRLRMGESVKLVAKRAGVTMEWVERFSAPVASEKASIVEMARGITCSKQRLGPSAAPMGKSVLANVLSKGVDMSRSEFDSGWSAFMIREGVWTIRFEYASRGRSQVAEWELAEDEAALVPSGRLASDLAYWDPETPLPSAALLGPAPRPSTRAVEPPKRMALSTTPVIPSVVLPELEQSDTQIQLDVTTARKSPRKPSPSSDPKPAQAVIAARPVSELAALAREPRTAAPHAAAPQTTQTGRTVGGVSQKAIRSPERGAHGDSKAPSKRSETKKRRAPARSGEPINNLPVRPPRDVSPKTASPKAASPKTASPKAASLKTASPKVVSQKAAPPEGDKGSPSSARRGDRRGILRAVPDTWQSSPRSEESSGSPERGNERANRRQKPQASVRAATASDVVRRGKTKETAVRKARRSGGASGMELGTWEPPVGGGTPRRASGR